MSDSLSTYDTSGDPYVPYPTGTLGTLDNTGQSVSTAVSQGGYNAVGSSGSLGAQLGALGGWAGSMDQSGTGVMGGQSPSTVPTSDSGVGGSGSGTNTTCMTGSETNSVTGDSSVGQGAEGQGCNPCDPAGAGGPGGGGSVCTGIGVANTGGLNDVADTSDPTDFAYTDNADCM